MPQLLLNTNYRFCISKPRIKDWQLLMPNAIKEYFDDDTIMTSFVTSKIKTLTEDVYRETKEISLSQNIIINVFINIFNLNTSNVDYIIKEHNLSKDIKEKIEELKIMITEGKNEEFENPIQRLGFNKASNLQNSFVHEMMKKQSTSHSKTVLHVLFGTKYSDQEYNLKHLNHKTLSRSTSESDILVR